MRHIILFASLGVLALAAMPRAGAAVGEEQAGVASAVNAATRGIAPISGERIMHIGADVFRSERILTDANGRAQLLFLDGSALTVAPNSDLVIDEFVYDPASGAGKLTMTITKGLLRFVGGQLSKQDDAVRFNTPFAGIGIRGGIGIVQVDPVSATGTLVFGEMTVESGGDDQEITRSGYGSISTSPDESPSRPTRQPLAELLAEFESQPGETGGLDDPPTDDDAAAAGLGGEELALLPETPGGGRAQGGPTPLAPGAADDAAQQQEGSQGNAENTLPPSGPPPGAGAPLVFAGRWFATVDGEPTLGWTGDHIPLNSQPFTQAVINGGFVTVTLADGRTVVVPYQPGAPGGFFTFGAGGTSSPFGPVSGRGFIAADQSFFFFELNETGNPGERQFFFGGTSVIDPNTTTTQVFALQVLPDFDLQSNIPFIRREGGGDIPNAVVSPLLVSPTGPAGGRMAIAAIAIDGVGAAQRSVIMGAAMEFFLAANGQLAFGGDFTAFARQSATQTAIFSNGGIAPVADANGAFVFAGPFTGSEPVGFVLDSHDWSTTPATFDYARETGVEYGFKHPALLTAPPAGVGASRSSLALNGYFAGMADTSTQATPYRVTVPNGPLDFALTTDPVLNVATATMNWDSPNGDTGQFLFGGPTNSSRSAFIDDDRFVLRQADGSSINGFPSEFAGGVLFSSDMAPLATLPGGVAPCDCQFLKWGWWGFAYNNNADIPGPDRFDQFHAGTWVAGELPAIADMPTNGSFTYAGHAIANIYNNGAQYIAAGSFAETFNFGTGAGTVTITGLDGRNYNGPVAGGRDYLTTAPIVSNDAAVQLELAGSFFRGGANPVAETGGDFDLQGLTLTPYSGVGTFAATQQ